MDLVVDNMETLSKESMAEIFLEKTIFRKKIKRRHQKTL
jgi:hypothetical protein